MQIPSKNFRQLCVDYAAWAEVTFPRTAGEIAPVLNHLEREIAELFAEVEEASELGWTEDLREAAMEEAADIVLLLIHMVHRMGGNLSTSVRDKIVINQLRDWGDEDEEGVSSHIEGS